MKFFSHKLLILSVALFLFSINADAQFASDKKKGKNLIVALGAGGAGVDGGYSLIGGNLMLEFRKPILVFKRDYSLTINLMGSAVMGSVKQTGKDSEFGFMPAGLLTFNINAYSQSTRIAKNRFGGFFGVGLMILPSQSIEKTNINGEKVTKSTGMFGPAVSVGPRFRIGKTYMDLRVFGGTTIGDADLAYGGVNIMFTLGMGKKKNHAMR